MYIIKNKVMGEIKILNINYREKVADVIEIFIANCEKCKDIYELKNAAE